MVLDYSINDNAIIRRLEDQQFVNKINNFIKTKAKEDFSHEIIEKFDVRGANNGYAIARSLSGGNQQKAIVGREMLTDHDFILIMQPTRGLDVGAINFIHQQIINEKAKGKGVLLISSRVKLSAGPSPKIRPLLITPMVSAKEMTSSNS